MTVIAGYAGKRLKVLRDGRVGEVADDRPAKKRAEEPKSAPGIVCKAEQPAAPTPDPAKTIAKLGDSIIAKARAANLRVDAEQPTTEAELIALSERIAKAADAELTRLAEPLKRALGATDEEARQALSETDHGGRLVALAALTQE